MAIAILISITALNVILWGIMLIRFRRLFSTDKIIEKARNEMNQMVYDLNNTTERDIFLTNEATQRVKNQIEEADRQMNSIITQYNEATNRLRSMLSEVEKNKNSGTAVYETAVISRNENTYQKPAAEIKPSYSSLKITGVSTGSVIPEPKKTVETPQISNKSTITKKIKSLYDEGYDIKQIAAELSCSETEVQLAIEML